MPLTPEQHLWACALEVERHHGKGAFLLATMRIDELTAEGEVEGARVWREILKRIEAREGNDNHMS